MNLLSFAKIELLRVAAELEFRFYRDNTNVRFRERYLRALGVEFERPISIGIQFYLRDRGRLKVGRCASFGSFTRIWNYSNVEIGDHFLSAGGLTINCGSHEADTLDPFAKPVRIGHRVWVGLNVTILGGVSIGDDSVIGAGAVVTRDVPAGTVWAGVPARQVKEVDRAGLSDLWGAWGRIPLPATPADSLADEARSRLESGRFVEARRMLERALNARPDEPVLLVLMAQAALSGDDVPAFEAALARALEMAPDFAPAHRLLGDLLFAGGQPGDAARHYEIVARQSPGDAGLLTMLERCRAASAQHQLR